MSTLEDLDDLEQEQKEEKRDEKKDGDDAKDGKKADGDADMKDAEPEEPLDEEILNLATRDVVARKRLLENDMRIMKSEFQRLSHEKASMNEKIRDNLDKIENNRYGSCITHTDTLADMRTLAGSSHTSSETSSRY
jgi:26S proteasome regulatory subunit T5